MVQSCYAFRERSSQGLSAVIGMRLLGVGQVVSFLGIPMKCSRALKKVGFSFQKVTLNPVDPQSLQQKPAFLAPKILAGPRLPAPCETHLFIQRVSPPSEPQPVLAPGLRKQNVGLYHRLAGGSKSQRFFFGLNIRPSPLRGFMLHILRT